MRIDLPTCGFKNCRHCFDGNCRSKLEYARCEYQALKAEKEVELVIASSECGDWEALYIDGKLVEENHRLFTDQVLSHLGQFLPITLVHLDVPDDIAEMGVPQDLSALTNTSNGSANGDS